MIAELVAVGTEILLGNIVNTNSAYLSEQMAQLGLYFCTDRRTSYDRRFCKSTGYRCSGV